MRFVKLALALGALPILLACASMRPASNSDSDPKSEVTQTERDFAKTMADRDHAAFESFLSDEAVFLSDSKPLRGKQEVAKAWEPFYEGAAAPFSWQPDQVEVLASGTLAISTGPVYNAQGKLVARFSSI